MKKLFFIAALVFTPVTSNIYAANELSRLSEEEQIVFQEFSESIIAGVNHAYDVYQDLFIAMVNQEYYWGKYDKSIDKRWLIKEILIAVTKDLLIEHYEYPQWIPDIHNRIKYLIDESLRHPNISKIYLNYRNDICTLCTPYDNKRKRNERYFSVPREDLVAITCKALMQIFAQPLITNELWAIAEWYG